VPERSVKIMDFRKALENEKLDICPNFDRIIS
jgi:hypothetical protein